jgi:hypothetical protein
MPLAEVMEDAIAMCLRHTRVNVVARVAQFGDLLSQQFDALCAVAEDDRLVDLQLNIFFLYLP